MDAVSLRTMIEAGDLSEGCLRVLLAFKRECEWLDYKEHLDLQSDHGRGQFARHVLALANVDGGYLVIGVKDATWRPVGLENRLPQDSKQLADIVFSCTGVRLKVDISQHDEGGRYFAVVLVRSGQGPILSEKDFFVDGERVIRARDVFIRRGDESVRIGSRDDLATLVASNKGDVALLIEATKRILRRPAIRIAVYALVGAAVLLIVSGLLLGSMKLIAFGIAALFAALGGFHGGG